VDDLKHRCKSEWIEESEGHVHEHFLVLVAEQAHHSMSRCQEMLKSRHFFLKVKG
jgi:hypothetical protein